MEFVAIDFETTGYENGGKNEPWQLGLALVRDGVIVETREWFFKVDDSFVRGENAASTIATSTIMELFEDWAPSLIGRRLVAHNIATERTILTRIAPLTKWGPWVDTLKLAKARYPRLKSYALGDLCEAFGLVPSAAELPVLSGRSWHDGLFDAVACARLAAFLAI